MADDTWHTANSVVFKWTAVKIQDRADGPEPIPEGFSVAYDVYYKDDLSGEVTGPFREAGTQVAVTFTKEGSFRVGVRAVKIRDDIGRDVSFSEISWSDNPEICVVMVRPLELIIIFLHRLQWIWRCKADVLILRPNYHAAKEV